MTTPADPARAVAKMLDKLDEEDKDTFNWCIRQGRAHMVPRVCPICTVTEMECPVCSGKDQMETALAEEKLIVERQGNAVSSLLVQNESLETALAGERSSYETIHRMMEEFQAESERLLTALRAVERNCPCGARPETPNSHPHVGGCPVGEALRS